MRDAAVVWRRNAAAYGWETSIYVRGRGRNWVVGGIEAHRVGESKLRPVHVNPLYSQQSGYSSLSCDVIPKVGTGPSPIFPGSLFDRLATLLEAALR